MPLAQAGKALRADEFESEDRPEDRQRLQGPAAKTFPKGESMENQAIQTEHQFSDAARAAVYQAIFSRRDVRGQFLPDPVPDEVLSRVLMAAHHAPSVGFMQPWNFLLVRSQEVKQRVHDVFKKANDEASQMFEGSKREIYSSLKLEGIIESPINLCITCDRERTGPVVVGRTHIRTMDLYSSVCAVQNLWLAARAEGLGVGWVSIFNQGDLQDALGIPRDITPVAYLCLGYVSHFYQKPELESAGWLPRLPIDQLVYFDQWAQKPKADETLIHQLRHQQATIQESGSNGLGIK
jgi:5,6-dimethylbenzimidazole synthase